LPSHRAIIFGTAKGDKHVSGLHRAQNFRHTVPVATEHAPATTEEAPATTTEEEQSGPAWRPLGLVAGVAALVMFALSGRYGFHRDELYYLAAGQHPAWGYDDQPPLAPLWAGLSHAIAGSWPDALQLMLLRLPATLAVAGVILLTGAIAYEFGGGRKAQLFAALTMAVAPVLVISGHLLSTTIFDILVWTALAYIFARWVRTRADKLLLLIGPVAGVGLLIKTLPLVYAFGLVVGLLVSSRAIFRRWQLWAGGAIAGLLWAPNVWWQASHGWPQVKMTAVIREDADWGGRAGLLPFQVLLLGVVAVLLWVPGLLRLLRDPSARPFRALGWAYLIVLIVVLATGGREYYPAGAYPALIASGALVLERRGLSWKVARAWLIPSAVITAALGLPIYPVAWLHATPQPAVNYDAGETVGWPGFADQVRAVYQGLPAGERATAVILAGNYGEAGALDHYGLPNVYSGHLSFWRWGPPPDSMTGPVVVVGHSSEADLHRECGSVDLAATIDNGLDLDNDEQGAQVWICRQPHRTWSRLWPGLYRM
jgi:Dolichyl-phosphate-mannose-protein mannosyltransferase